MIHKVVLAKQAEKQLKKIPLFIIRKLQSWVESVEKFGLEEIRKIPGYHDEPLQGKRLGQRSIRLSVAYRAIYSIKNDKIEFVFIEEVSKHDY